MPSKPSSAKRTVFDYFINEHGEWNRWLARLTIPPAVARASGGDLATSVTPWRMAFDAIKPAACGSGIPIATRLNLVGCAVSLSSRAPVLAMLLHVLLRALRPWEATNPRTHYSCQL